MLPSRKAASGSSGRASGWSAKKASILPQRQTDSHLSPIVSVIDSQFGLPAQLGQADGSGRCSFNHVLQSFSCHGHRSAVSESAGPTVAGV